MGSGRLRFLLDSVIVIDHFNAIAPATDFLRDHGDDCAVSVVTRAEVLAGFNDPGAAMACGLLDMFPTLPLLAEAADVAATLRRRRHLKLPDAFQAALALEHQLVLVTRNRHDFRGDGLPQVLVPYRI